MGPLLEHEAGLFKGRLNCHGPGSARPCALPWIRDRPACTINRAMHAQGRLHVAAQVCAEAGFVMLPGHTNKFRCVVASCPAIVTSCGPWADPSDGDYDPVDTLRRSAR